MWRCMGLTNTDFEGAAELFPAVSYQHVLYDMGFESDFDWQAYLYQDQPQQERIIERNQQLTEQMLGILPPHHEYIEH